MITKETRSHLHCIGRYIEEVAHNESKDEAARIDELHSLELELEAVIDHLKLAKNDLIKLEHEKKLAN